MMSGLYECPLDGCFTTWGLPDFDKVPAAFADILGTSPLGLHEGWMHHAKTELEREIDKHLRAHQPAEWVGEIQRLKALLAGMTEAMVALGSELR